MSISLIGLKELIHSLSPSEKQQFKKKNNTESDYNHLFDFLNRSKKLDPESFLKFLRKKNKSSKDYTTGYLSVLKNYLKDKILDSLRIQFFHKRPPYELITRSINSDILLEKGLNDLARNEIEETKEKFIGSSFPIEKLLLLRKESILIFYENYQSINLDEINELFNQRLLFAEQMVLEVQYARILTILSYQYFKGERNDEMLKSFMSEPFIQDKSFAKDFATKYLYHWVHAQFSEFKEDKTKALHHFELAIKTWLEHPAYIDANPRMYMGACFTYLRYILQIRQQYSEILEIDNFEQLLSSMKAIHLSPDEKQRYEQLFKVGQLLALRRANKFNEILALRNEIIENDTLDESRLGFSSVMILYFLSISLFETKKYKQANEFISSLLIDRIAQLRNNPEYFSLFIMLSLACQYELNMKKFMKYQHKRLKKQLIDFNQFDSFEKIFFQMIGQLISPRYEAKLDSVFDRFHKRLKTCLQNENLDTEIEYQFLISWISKKINRNR